MLFDQEMVGLTVLDVLTLHQQNIKVDNKGRPFSALSFRYDSDTQIQCGEKIYDVSNAVCFFPAQMSYRRIAREDHLYVIHFDSHTYFSTKLELFIPEQPQQYRKLFEEAYECWNSGQSAYRYKTAAILYQILALAYQENSQKSSLDPLVRQAVQLLNENCFAADFQVSTVAQELHISQVYLRRLFRTAMGVSPKRYVLQQRMNKAISLLESSYYSVGEVASLCGFSDAQYFSVIFKKYMGISPSEYTYR